MGELIRARLTGRFRDQEVPTATNRDPGCEAEFVDLNDPLGAKKTAMVTFASGQPCPWYAAMAHFFGTLACTTGTSSVPDLPDPPIVLRSYTVAAPMVSREVVVSAIRSADPTATTVCIKLPVDVSFQAVVMGRTGPNLGAGDGEGMPTGANAVDVPGWGVQPVVPNSWCRLAVVAADGTSYGAGMDGFRWVQGFYPGPRQPSFAPGTTPPGTTAALGTTIGESHALNASQPVLQFGSPVTLVARNYDILAVSKLWDNSYSWQIVPGGQPGSVVCAKDGADAWGTPYAEFDTAVTYTRPVIVAMTNGGLWSKASDVTAPDNSIVLGIAVGYAGPDATALKILNVLVGGRFWVDPSQIPLEPHTTYYLSTEAIEGSAQAGFWSTTAPLSGCTKPVFQHFSDGWCILAAGASAGNANITVSAEQVLGVGLPVYYSSYGACWAQLTPLIASDAMKGVVIAFTPAVGESPAFSTILLWGTWQHDGTIGESLYAGETDLTTVYPGLPDDTTDQAPWVHFMGQQISNEIALIQPAAVFRPRRIQYCLADGITQVVFIMTECLGA